MRELEHTKERMESYRLRAETAEKERDESRKSLAEMITSIRKEEDERVRRRASHAVQTSPVESAETVKPKEAKSNGVHHKKRPGGMAVAARASPDEVVRKNFGREHALPYASVIGVIVFGVGLMSVLNSWQRGAADRS